MSADLLRRAAAVLREHAEAASGANWDSDGTEIYAEGGGVWIGQMDGNEAEGVANARLAALIHPPVALALADAMADRADECSEPHGCNCWEAGSSGAALVRVAHEVLREDAQ